LVRIICKVGTKDVLVEQGYESAKLAALSMLGSLKRELGNLEKVAAWLQVRIMVNTVEGFILYACFARDLEKSINTKSVDWNLLGILI
jgi:hypothetical protein